MVYRTDIPDRNRGQIRPRYSSNEKPNNKSFSPVVFNDADDRRSAYLRNSYIDNVNATRKQQAINDRNNNLDYAMSRSPEFYQNIDNLRDIKGILASTPAMTTDQNEKRNMYQMLMNQMKGGDKGARLIDTSGLPSGATRYGRTLFNDPAKSQGFLGDLNSFRTGKNEAAVRAPEYNPFPKAGFGEEFYEDEFGGFDFGGLMEGIFKMAPYTGAASKIASVLGGNRDRKPLERDPSFLPENNQFDIEFDEMENIPFMGDELINDEFNILDAYAPFDAPFNAEKLRREGRAGLFNLEDNILPTPVDSIDRILSEDGEVEIDMDAASEDIELSDIRKNELRNILLSEEFQLLPYQEKLPILESFGYTEPDLLQGINQ